MNNDRLVSQILLDIQHRRGFIRLKNLNTKINKVLFTAQYPAFTGLTGK